MICQIRIQSFEFRIVLEFVSELNIHSHKKYNFICYNQTLFAADTILPKETNFDARTRNCRLSIFLRFSLVFFGHIFLSLSRSRLYKVNGSRLYNSFSVVKQEFSRTVHGSIDRSKMDSNNFHFYCRGHRWIISIWLFFVLSRTF